MSKLWFQYRYRRFAATLSSALLAATCVTGAAATVDDLRAADRMSIDAFQCVAAPSVEYSLFVKNWYSLDGEPFAGEPGTVPKTPGTLDMDLGLLLPGYDLPGLAATGTEQPGDIVVWDLDKDVNQDFALEFQGRSMTVTVTHAEGEITALVQSVADFYSTNCQRVFNCALVDTGGDSANHITIDFFMNEATRAILVEQAGIPSFIANVLTGNARLTFQQIDYVGSSGTGTAPLPQATLAAWKGGNLEFVFERVLTNAPYALQGTFPLSSSNWTDVAYATATGTGIRISIPLPVGKCSFYRLTFEPTR